MSVTAVLRTIRSVTAAVWASSVVGDEEKNGGLWCSPIAKTSRPTSSARRAICTIASMRSASLGVRPVTGFRVMSLTEKIPNCIADRLIGCTHNHNKIHDCACIEAPRSRGDDEASAVRDLTALQPIAAQLLRMTVVEPAVDVDHVARREQLDDLLVDHVDLVLDCIEPLLVEHASLLCRSRLI